ncbi:MAG: M16 family metallopeptidase [Prevotella sp.]|jgi:predicted Zn-dependent peptidase
MKKISFVLLLLLTVFTVQAKDYKYTTVAGDPMQARIYTLDNGLKVYLSVNKAKPRIQTFIAVRTGSRNDPAETTGLAHYLEHIMFKGTTHFGTSDMTKEKPYLDEIEARYEKYRKLTDPAQRKQAYHEIDSVSQLAAKYNIPNEYDKMMSAIGSEGSNAYTSNDVTCYVENIPSNEVDNWARVQADRFQNMVIRGFHTELEAVYEEYNMGLTQDTRKLWDATAKMLFPTHPYGTQTTIGTQQHLKNPSITNIKNYFKRYYVPNNVAICMAGDFDPDQVIAIIDKYFSSWKPSPNLSEPQYAPLKPITQARDTTVYGQEAETVVIAWRFDKANSLQQDTLTILNQLVCNGKAGLLDVDLNQPMKVQSSDDGVDALNDYSSFYLYGQPKEGQTMQEVRQLLLNEVKKVRDGNFDDDLLPAIVNNYKRYFYEQLDNNRFRANQFVDAFINRIPWQQSVNVLNRISKLTKADIVKFANEHLGDNNMITVYKAQGNDTTIHKIEKPAITPIPTNTDKHSAFLDEIVNAKVQPIQPQFVDFNKDLSKTTFENGKTTLLYKQNNSDDLFTLGIVFPVGIENTSKLSVASKLIDYASTDKMSLAEVQKAFYTLACDYSVSSSNDETAFYLSGLNSNLSKALTLFYQLLENGKVSKEDYTKIVDNIMKERNDQKKEQGSCFRALMQYGTNGSYNFYTSRMSEKEMREADPNDLLRLISNLRHQCNATVMYYGPTPMNDLEKLISKSYPRRSNVAPFNYKPRRFEVQPSVKQEVYIAPYDAKNIYLVQFYNENLTWTPDHAAIDALFNNYFGGGMNTIVFQELREARGLAYSAGAGYGEPSRPEDKEEFYTFIITQNDKMVDCVNEFNKLLNNMPESQAGLELAKQNLMKDIASQRTLKFNILAKYYSAQRLGLDYDINKKIYETVPTLTMSDLVQFAKDRIANKPYRYLILGDEKELDMNAVKGYGPITRLSLEQIFGE